MVPIAYCMGQYLHQYDTRRVRVNISCIDRQDITLGGDSVSKTYSTITNNNIIHSCFNEREWLVRYGGECTLGGLKV